MRARLPPHVIMFGLTFHSSPLVLPRHLRLLIKFMISSWFYNFLIKFVILRGFLIRNSQSNQESPLIRIGNQLRFFVRLLFLSLVYQGKIVDIEVMNM